MVCCRMDTSWSAQPAAARIVARLVAQLVARAPWVAELRQALREQTATALVDWLDHLALPPSAAVEERWRAAGFVAQACDGLVVHRHPGGRFPALVSDPSLPAGELSATLRVDAVADACAALGVGAGAGPVASGGVAYRRARIAGGPRWSVWAVERHGWAGFSPPPARDPDAALAHRAAFDARPRQWTDPAAGFADLHARIDRAIADLGRDETCARFFAAERDFWQSRNRAARIQRGRQDALGLGWANHDHHTYRASRRWFGELIAVLEKLGLECRERFHAGAEAGWGAQVLESPATGIVVFADVDLTPDEAGLDIAHRPLPPLPALGTVGLWCALHGEALFAAGMHHLECTFLHDELTRQLAGLGVAMMRPFTDLPHLKQAFTAGERWPVAAARLTALRDAGLLSAEQVARFRAEGAIGSHLENLERREGYKGFNQRGVSHIIAGTDPRAARQ